MTNDDRVVNLASPNREAERGLLQIKMGRIVIFAQNLP